jgi:hypothetical protein
VYNSHGPKKLSCKCCGRCPALAAAARAHGKLSSRTGGGVARAATLPKVQAATAPSRLIGGSADMTLWLREAGVPFLIASRTGPFW